jgi:hypothetical protein
MLTNAPARAISSGSYLTGRLSSAASAVLDLLIRHEYLRGPLTLSFAASLAIGFSRHAPAGLQCAICARSGASGWGSVQGAVLSLDAKVAGHRTDLRKSLRYELSRVVATPCENLRRGRQRTRKYTPRFCIASTQWQPDFGTDRDAYSSNSRYNGQVGSKKWRSHSAEGGQRNACTARKWRSRSASC